MESKDPLYEANSLSKSLDVQLKAAYELPHSDLQTVKERLTALEARQSRLSAAVIER